METALGDDLAVMRAAALEAGALALSFLQDGPPRVWTKAPGEPVTAADIAVNALLEEQLRSARPDYGWLSEETRDDAADRRARRTWVIDPIDGTRAFLKMTPHWCIALAVVEAGSCIAAVLHAPALGETFEARRGGGAFLNGAALTAGDHPEIAGARLIASPEMLRHKAWPEPWPAVDLIEPKPNSTLLRMAYVAAGRADATLVLSRKWDWDVASGSLLVAEAGGVATTHLGEPFRLNRPVPAQRSLLAAGKVLHPLLVRRARVVDLPDPDAGPPQVTA